MWIADQYDKYAKIVTFTVAGFFSGSVASSAQTGGDFFDERPTPKETSVTTPDTVNTAEIADFEKIVSGQTKNSEMEPDPKIKGYVDFSLEGAAELEIYTYGNSISEDNLIGVIPVGQENFPAKLAEIIEAEGGVASVKRGKLELSKAVDGDSFMQQVEESGFEVIPPEEYISKKNHDTKVKESEREARAQGAIVGRQELAREAAFNKGVTKLVESGVVNFLMVDQNGHSHQATINVDEMQLSQGGQPLEGADRLSKIATLVKYFSGENPLVAGDRIISKDFDNFPAAGVSSLTQDSPDGIISFELNNAVNFSSATRMELQNSEQDIGMGKEGAVSPTPSQNPKPSGWQR